MMWASVFYCIIFGPPIILFAISLFPPRMALEIYVDVSLLRLLMRITLYPCSFTVFSAFICDVIIVRFLEAASVSRDRCIE